MDASDPTLEAWRDFCGGLAAAGEQLLGPDFPAAPAERAEGFRHLAEQVVCWLGWSVGHADPATPAFQRQNDLVTKWGGPNDDNVYHHARVDPAYRYRITGRMHSCDDFILAVRAGFMHMPRWGTLVEVTGSDLGIGPGDDFELLVGAGGDIDLPEGAVMVSVREYYFDWQPAEPAIFTIECLDGPADGARPPVADQLREAQAGTEHSLTYWNRYLRDHRAAGVDNTFGTPVEVGKGLEAARYAFCFYDLGPDEALYIETDEPPARYWSLQLYRLAWFEPFDFARHVGGLNHTQAAVDTDGRVRLVVAHRDPGVANWLDTAGRPEGLVLFRWFWPTADPTPSAEVVAFDQLATVLPADTARVAADERQRTIDARRRHVAWRFRT